MLRFWWTFSVLVQIEICASRNNKAYHNITLIYDWKLGNLFKNQKIIYYGTLIDSFPSLPPSASVYASFKVHAVVSELGRDKQVIEKLRFQYHNYRHSVSSFWLFHMSSINLKYITISTRRVKFWNKNEKVYRSKDFLHFCFLSLLLFSTSKPLMYTSNCWKYVLSAYIYTLYQ